ncbi:hypothetical protein SEUCBS139899_010706 [Sporothrix eucalyptigena]|uniref:C2H2-type domain-containing protein n=1 Tax=Sporothrix eucalyptigena TaxID=1812306 RepID=A0ABP0D1J0_9PEZI
MALDLPAVAYGTPEANIAAARQHVQTLSARDREALLRALLEQYEHPQTSLQGPPPVTSLSSRSSSATSTASISAFATSSFGCPPLKEEVEEEPALSPPPLRASTTTSTTTTASSSTSTATSSRWTAPSSTPAHRLRSQSFSISNPQPLRSSFSASHLQQSFSHGRSRSMSSTMDEDIPQPLRIPAEKKTLPKPTLTIDTEVAAAATSTTIQQQQKPFTYWCTACGEKLHGRTAWVQHDVACRGNERRLAREGRISGSHGCGGRTQRAWACGFCAAFLGSLERYQSHVAGHFERGRTLAHWHFANVIYGLLHQPAVHKPWKRLWAARAAALPSHLRPKATWSPGCCLLGREESDTQIPLQEALEFFDQNFDSASTLALQADALAIYISVPIDDDAQKSQQKLVVIETKTKSKEQAVPAASAQIMTATQQPESLPSPATSTTNLLPAPISKTSPPAPTGSAQTKDTPLPALPNLSTAPAAVTPESTKKDSKRESKVSPRKPLFFFKSRSPPSSPESTVEKTTAVKGEAPPRQVIRKSPSSGTKLSKPRPVAPSSHASVSAPSIPHTTSTTTIITATRARARHTTPSRRNNWADRPLPPLIMDDFSLTPARSSSTAPPIYSRMATGHASDQPPSPPPKPGAHRATASSDSRGDWNSIATTIVEDIMAPVNALHITVG